LISIKPHIAVIILLLTTNIALAQQPLIDASQQSRKFNMQFDVKKNHLSGMLISRKMPDGNVRLVATSYFGMSIFDFTLADTMVVNQCIDPLKRRSVLKLIERDFKPVFVDKSVLKRRKKHTNFEAYKRGHFLGKAKFDVLKDELSIRHSLLRMSIKINEL